MKMLKTQSVGGKVEDLAWFRQAWETHARQFHHGMTPEALVGGMRKYCVPREISRMIEPARDPEEAWRLLESHFNKETKWAAAAARAAPTGLRL